MSDLSKIILPDNSQYTLKDPVARVSIPFGQVDSTSTSTVFTATIPGITELYDGVCIFLRNGVVTSASGCTLDINGLGAKPIYSTMSADTRIATVFNVAYTMLFIYNSTRVEGGCWDMYYGYYKDTTMAYGSLDYYFRPYVGEKLYRYKLVLQGKDNRIYPVTLTNQTSGTQVAKTPTSVGLRPGRIWYYASTSAINAGAVVGAQTLQKIGYTTAAAYNFNTSISTYRTVYLRGTYNVDEDLFYLYNDGGSPCTSYYTQVPTNTANITLSDYFVEGYYYMLVGGSYSTANYLSIFGYNPLYYFDGTNLIPASTKVAWDLVADASVVNLTPSVYYDQITQGNTFTRSGITFTLNADGSVTADGTASSQTWYSFTSSTKTDIVPVIYLDPNKTYTLSGCPSGGSTSTYSIHYRFYIASQTPNTSGTGAVNKDDIGTAQQVNGYRYAEVYISIKNGATLSNVTFNPMIEVGSAAHAYVPSNTSVPQVGEVTVSSNGAVSRALSPNVVYHFTGNLTSLTITFVSSTIATAHYHFDFISGSTAPTLTLPSTVVMPDDFSVDGGKRYEIDILSNYGTAQSWGVS